MKSEELAGYVKPTPVFIGRGKTTERLYKLEEAYHETFRKATEELASVLGIPKELYWKKALPQALLTLLESYDPKASVLACISYLESKGYAVKTS
jgi:hypothetical protein